MPKDTVSIHGKEYETVASRVKRFREDHPDWTIRTKIIEVTENRVIMKATIEVGTTSETDYKRAVIATGHAEEVRAASTINKTSALENCETSAIGRALACLGYLGTEFASADEVAEAIKQQGKSADPKHWSNKKGFPEQPADKPATDKQRQALVKSYAERSGVPDMPLKEAEKQLASWVGEAGIDWANLTHSDVQTLFDDIRRTSTEENQPKDPPNTE